MVSREAVAKQATASRSATFFPLKHGSRLQGFETKMGSLGIL